MSKGVVSVSKLLGITSPPSPPTTTTILLQYWYGHLPTVYTQIHTLTRKLCTHIITQQHRQFTSTINNKNSKQIFKYYLKTTINIT